MLLRHNADNDGALKKDEMIPFFLHLIQNREDLGLDREDYGGWFNSIDTDGDGLVKADELEAYLTHINFIA